jgi:hypothetical protein
MKESLDGTTQGPQSAGAVADRQVLTADANTSTAPGIQTGDAANRLDQASLGRSFALPCGALLSVISEARPCRTAARLVSKLP